MLSPARLQEQLQQCCRCLPRAPPVNPTLKEDLLNEPEDTTANDDEPPPSPVVAPAPPSKPVVTSSKPKAQQKEPVKPVKPAAPLITPEMVLQMDAPAVIATMQNAEYQNDAALMSAACKQLRVLCRKDEACIVCDKLNAAELICATMSRHVGAATVQQQACAALINLCAGESFGRRDRAVSSGALPAIVDAMNTHLEYPGIQEMAFVAIQNICFGNDAKGTARKEQAIKAGAFEAIIAGILKFEDTPSLLDQGSATLRLLCNKNQLLKVQAMNAGAKKEWLKSSGLLSARVGGLLTNRKSRNAHLRDK